MGLRNISDRSGSVFKGFFGGLSSWKFFSELFSANREIIDYDSPIIIKRYNVAGDYIELPKESYERVQKLLDLIYNKRNKAFKGGMVFAHDYLSNPKFVSIIRDYIQEETRLQKSQDTPSQDYEVIKTFQILAHLWAASIHINKRSKQKKKPKIEEVLTEINSKLIPQYEEQKKYLFY